MKLLLKFLFLIIYFFLFTNKVLCVEKERIIVLGHLYPIIHDEEKFNNLKKKINSYKPNYIFLLGDSLIDDPNIFKKYINSFNNSELYFSPGNHELKSSKSNYLKNVGYFDLFKIKKNFNFLLINSSDSLNNIKSNIIKFLSNIDNNKPTILFTHHRIWDDTLISKKPFQHDKSYYFDELYPLIENRIQYIFSGNSKRQYFKDLENKKTYGKQNLNNIFWFDKIKNINAYSVGMGDGYPKANFTIVDVYEDKILITGDYSSNDNLHLISRNKVIPDTSHLIQNYDRSKYFFINKNKFYLFLIIILLFIIIKKIMFNK